jgi:hypothetical protein
VSDFVTIECPKCGNTAIVKASAFAGGWCVGSLERATQHKPANWKVLDEDKSS